RMPNESTIEIRDGCKSYGRGKNKTLVLNHIDLTVPTGSIYGLLGPSGCGKTTLLNTMVNRLTLDHGSVLICGYKPGSVAAAVPGHRVGFMPQELALMPALTIGESLQYFGRIHNLGEKKTKERTDFLISFLDLPTPSRLISQLSGGQQRRVSFAVALLHEPELLILDEPTVGVDPLLRTNIWQHLNKVSKSTNATIIITTHYIEEARQASRVGLMRRGHLLAEASPDNLMQHFGNPSLEDVFLELCLRDGRLDPTEKKNSTFEKEAGIVMQAKAVPDGSQSYRASTELVVRSSSSGTYDMLQEPTVLHHAKRPWTTTSKRETYLAWGRFSALTVKNVINLARNTMFLALSFLLPAIQTVLFCVAIGGTPKDLHVAVTNLDKGL
ncbi:ABC transporter-like, partial [Trinorchestia longiramus]